MRARRSAQAVSTSTIAESTSRGRIVCRPPTTTALVVSGRGRALATAESGLVRSQLGATRHDQGFNLRRTGEGMPRKSSSISLHHDPNHHLAPSGKACRFDDYSTPTRAHRPMRPFGTRALRITAVQQHSSVKPAGFYPTRWPKLQIEPHTPDCDYLLFLAAHCQNHGYLPYAQLDESRLPE